MFHFDASALIDLWDNYPIQRPMFDDVWRWFDEKVSDGVFCISDVALKEVKGKIIYKTPYTSLEQDMPESKLFIQALDKFEVYSKVGDDLKNAGIIKEALDIQEDNYHKDGVGENDLLIIAITNRAGATLITNEKIQNKLPANKQKYKIPAVCNLDQMRVKNISLQKLLRLNI